MLRNQAAILTRRRMGTVWSRLSHPALDYPLFNQRSPQLIRECDNASEVGRHSLIGARPLTYRDCAVEADPGRRAGSNLGLPRQGPTVALQGAVSDVHDEVDGRKRPAGRVGRDGGGSDLAPGSGRPRPGADELRALLVAPELAHAPRPGGRRAIQGVRCSVLVRGQSAEWFLAGDDPVLLRQGHEAGGVADVEKAAGGDGAHVFLTVISS